MAKMFEVFEDGPFKRISDHYRASLDRERLGVSDSLGICWKRRRKKETFQKPRRRRRCMRCPPSNTSSTSKAHEERTQVSAFNNDQYKWMPIFSLSFPLEKCDIVRTKSATFRNLLKTYETEKS